MSNRQDDSKTDEQKSQEHSQLQQEEGNALIPLYWFVGAVVLLVLLTWLGSEG